MLPETAVAHLRSPSRVAWWHRASDAQIFSTGAGVALAIFVLVAGFDLLSANGPGMFYVKLAVDTLVALLCGTLLIKIMRDSRARYRSLLKRLQMIADMNHHIRNALEQIEMSAHTTKDQELVNNIHTAVSRIQWALREVLPAETAEPPRWTHLTPHRS